MRVERVALIGPCQCNCYPSRETRNPKTCNLLWRCKAVRGTTVYSPWGQKPECCVLVLPTHPPTASREKSGRNAGRGAAYGTRCSAWLAHLSVLESGTRLSLSLTCARAPSRSTEHCAHTPRLLRLSCRALRTARSDVRLAGCSSSNVDNVQRVPQAAAKLAPRLRDREP